MMRCCIERCMAPRSSIDSKRFDWPLKYVAHRQAGHDRFATVWQDDRSIKARQARKRPRHKSGANLIASKPSRSVPAAAAAALETYVEARRSPAPAISALPPPTAAIAILDRLRQRILGRDRSLAVRPNRDRRCGACRRSNHEQRTGHHCGFADHSLHPPVGLPPSTPAGYPQLPD